MTQIEIYKALIQKQDELIKHFKSAYYHNGIQFKFGNFFYTRKVKKIEKELASLQQQLAEYEEDKQITIK